jgi:DNA replication protein DnaC
MTDTVKFRRALGRVDLERMNLPEELWLAKVQYVSDGARTPTESYLRKIDEAVVNGAGLIIHGARGVGKTAIAALIAKEARSRGYTAFFTRVWELREMIRSRMDYDADSTVAERARAVDVLILDDLRQEDAGEKFFTLSEIHQLVKYRASRRRITVVTTRLSVQVLDKSPMDALSDVLLLFPVEGPNLRKERKRVLEQSILGT